MIDPMLAAFLVSAILCALVGFVGGRISTAPKEPRAVKFDLSDEALAHITHEAIRAYQRSLGVIRLKTWNNLAPQERARLTDQATNCRRFPEPVYGPQSALRRAIASISSRVNLAR